jgi:hypothetical protein
MLLIQSVRMVTLQIHTFLKKELTAKYVDVPVSMKIISGCITSSYVLILYNNIFVIAPGISPEPIFIQQFKL